MQHVNWVQQNEDYATRYHVLQWKTSHFHEPFSIRTAGGAKPEQSAGAAPKAGGTRTEPEGLGIGQPDRGSGRIGVGLGLEESHANMVAGNEKGHDGVSLSAHGMRAQENGQGAARAAAQSAALAQVHAAEHTVTPASEAEVQNETEQSGQAGRENTTVAQSGRGNIRNRLQESAARLREAYQRQKEKAEKRISLKWIKPEKKEEKVRKGTRTADREAMLSMQAENHYLLDSYDQNGNYSMLGKR